MVKGSKKMTEREHALQTIRDKFTVLGDELAERAVDNVNETEQSASFSVKATLEPTGEPKEIKVKVGGKITLSAGQTTEHMNLGEQVRMDDVGE